MSAVTAPPTLTITIYGTPPHELSPNRIIRLTAGQRTRIKGELARAWYYAAYQALYEARIGQPFPEHGAIVDPWKPALFDGPVRCQITVYRGKGAKPWDADNLLSGLKFGIDQLQAAGVVRNDNQLRFDPIKQEKARDGQGYTVVVLEEIGCGIESGN